MTNRIYKIQTRFLFHSNIKIKVPEYCEDEIFDELFYIMENIDKNYNSYSAGSYFDQINKNKDKYTKVDDVTISLLEILNEYSKLLNNNYDITIMPLIRLWGFYTENKKEIPTQNKINKVLKIINYKNIKVDKKEQKVKIGKNQEIITGSFIKSYAVDKVIQRLKERNIENAIINAGGSSIRGLNNNIQKKWIISVEDSENPDKILFDLELENMSCSTSASGNNFIEIENKKYSHILNPKTGYPAKNKQICIITKESMTGDILSTGLYNCEPEEFLETLKKIRKRIYIEGFLVDKNGKFHYSKDFKKYINH